MRDQVQASKNGHQWLALNRARLKRFFLCGMGVLLSGAILCGCGYTLSHRLKPAFRNPKGIFVPVFDNLTDEVGAERVLTNALIRELQSRGEIVFSSREQGASELRGTINSISYLPTNSTPPGFKGLQPYRRLPAELNVYISMSLELIDEKTKKTAWSGGFGWFRRVAAPPPRTYDFEAPSSVGLLVQSVAESRYQDIARDMMRDVYDEMVELF